ncbi:hypothetical protein [uncultured Bacteroides sp.]|uniref:hypothetical protein n=1 Tax=uncultured Bacteroides sp. TaxID=162156 RepID=UPI002606C745|nr:hypothetical protein [uncultured Bacteroides sp.]
MERKNIRLTPEMIIHFLLHNRLVSCVSNILFLLMFSLISLNNKNVISYIFAALFSIMAAIDVTILLYLSWKKYKKNNNKKNKK